MDDPVQGAAEADFDAYKGRLLNEFTASLLTRPMPGGSAIVVLTRWAHDDVAECCWPSPTADGGR